MLMLKACPRCRGDLGVVRDIGESYLSCLQCGYTGPSIDVEPPPPAPAALPPPARRRAA